MWDAFRKLDRVTMGLALGCGLLYLLTGRGLWFALAVTFVTISYHIYMRIWVGLGVNAIMHNRADYRSWWFRVSKGEERLYRRLKIHSWKNRLPTQDPESFNPKTHSWDQLAQTTCQSEVVHELNLVLSFVPVLAAHWVGGFPAFIITSVLAALIESVFVMLQRYNRARMVRLIDWQTRAHQRPSRSDANPG